jgi:hypothetical protein
LWWCDPEVQVLVMVEPAFKKSEIPFKFKPLEMGQNPTTGKSKFSKVRISNPFKKAVS